MWEKVFPLTKRTDKLTFQLHVDAVCKKAHQGTSIESVEVLTLTILYSCFIKSGLTFSFASWYPLRNRNRLQGIIKVCSIIAGMLLIYLPHLYKVRAFEGNPVSPGLILASPVQGVHAALSVHMIVLLLPAVQSLILNGESHSQAFFDICLSVLDSVF